MWYVNEDYTKTLQGLEKYDQYEVFDTEIMKQVVAFEKNNVSVEQRWEAIATKMCQIGV